MATSLEPCPECGSQTRAHVGQTIRASGAIAWSHGVHCSACGHAEESDEIGIPPAHYRRLILDEDGAWEVVVSDVARRTSVGVVAKEALKLSLAEALELSRKVPGPIWAGTRCEAIWLCGLFGQRGIPASVRRL